MVLYLCHPWYKTRENRESCACASLLSMRTTTKQIIVSDADLAVDVDRAGDVAEVEGEEGADVDEQEAPAASTATPAEAAR
jgi:hypothetical protein